MLLTSRLSAAGWLGSQPKNRHFILIWHTRCMDFFVGLGHALRKSALVYRRQTEEPFEKRGGSS